MTGSPVMRGTKVRAEYHRGNPTLGEIEAFLAVVDQGDIRLAADALGIKVSTIRRQMDNLYARIGATCRVDALRIMWPVVADQVTIFGQTPRPIVPQAERRLGYDRRRAA